MPIVLLILIAIGAAGCAAQKTTPEVRQPHPIRTGYRPAPARVSSGSSVTPKTATKPPEPIIDFGDDCPDGSCRPKGR